MNADIPTMLLMIVVNAIVMAGSVLVVAGGSAAEGLRRWSAALLVHALAFVLVGLRGRIGDFQSVVLGNTLLSASFALMLAAVYQYQGRRMPWVATVVPVLLTFVLAFPLMDNAAGRVLWMSPVYVVQIAVLIAALRSPHQGARGHGSRLIVAALAFAMLVLAARIFATAAGKAQLDMAVDRNLLQSLSFLTALVAVLATSIGFVFMIKERADEHNRILATLDPLTGVANRRFIVGALERDLQRAVRSRRPLSVLMIDIDHFKTVNDVYGHPVGDQVLCHVVELLRKRIRAQDLLGRYGGEEFLAVLPDTTPDGARRLAEKLRQAVAGSPCPVAGQPVVVTVSIGVQGGSIGPGNTWGQLIQEADTALYRAKDGGRNRVEVASLLETLPGTLRPTEPGSLQASRAA